MNEDFKKFIYDFSLIIFQWSLVYLLVLFFLEDFKPFLVSSQFSPHWIILILLISTAGLLRFAKQGGYDPKPAHTKLTRFDIWLVNSFGVIIALVWLFFLRDYMGGWALGLAVIVYFIIKKSTYWFLFKK